MEIRGRAVVVTGAGSGIGAATASRLAMAGAQVVIVDVSDTASVLAALPGSGHRSVVADVGDIDAMRRLFVELAADRVDLGGIVNSAGILTGGASWPDADLERIAKVIAVNALGSSIVATLAATYPLPGNRCVVNVSSVAAVLPHPPDPTYALTKAGMLAFTRSAAANGAVRINAVLPGVVRTPMLATTGVGGPADWIRDRLDGPLLLPDDVAEVIVRLLTDDHQGQAWTVELDDASGKVKVADA